MRKAAVAVGLALGPYLIVRAVAEPCVIDPPDQAAYRGLVGALAPHHLTRAVRGDDEVVGQRVAAR